MVLIKGKNNTNAKHAFTMRRNYRYNGFQIKGYPLAIDMWYEKPYYGRTNHDGDAVYLSEQFLSPIQNTGDKTIQAVNFVVDAFHALVKEWRAVKNTRSRKKGFFSEITAVKAWPAPGVHSMYRLYEETLYNTFIKTFLTFHGRKDKIVTVEDFMEVFVEFVDTMAPRYPFSRSALILSKYSDPMLSGLMIEIASADHGDDRIKNRVFNRDQDYLYFRRLAAKHGFMIDKNAPWRLVANINSKEMNRYMKPYGVDATSLFKRYYYTSYRGGLNLVGNDVSELRVFVHGIYTSLVNSNPYARPADGFVQGCDGKVSSGKTIPRQNISFEDFVDKYDDRFWLKMYMYIRAKENGKQWDEKHFNRKAKKMLKLHRKFDTETVLRYINTQTLPSESDAIPGLR